MNGGLSLRNRQRTRPVNLRSLRRRLHDLLAVLLELREFDLTVHLVNAREMTQLNQTLLGHEGPTDVITLDYSEAAHPDALTGEIFVCVDEAVLQAGRFRATWPAELIRYIIHGVLHLRGHNDLEAKARRRMKREENRLLNEMRRRFDLSKPKRAPTVTG
jgi:probable rRNA maturation factor